MTISTSITVWSTTNADYNEDPSAHNEQTNKVSKVSVVAI